MKLLIYGDSNTWGDNMVTNKRIPSNKQWPVILNNKLGKEVTIYQEGLPGRVAGSENKDKPYKNGKDYFLGVFKSCAPVDMVIIALGTNDLQEKYNVTSTQVINDLKWYTEALKLEYEDDPVKYFDNKFPKIYYLLPTNFNTEDCQFNINSELKRQEIFKNFKSTNEYTIIVPENTTLSDGLHLDYNGHDYIANLVYESITKSE